MESECESRSEFGLLGEFLASLSNDNVVDTAHAGTLLGVFGFRCQGCEGTQEVAGQPQSLMATSSYSFVNDLGFVDPESYAAWLAECRPQEREAHLQDVIEMIQEAR